MKPWGLILYRNKFRESSVHELCDQSSRPYLGALSGTQAVPPIDCYSLDPVGFSVE